jgi:hypothetical protein
MDCDDFDVGDTRAWRCLISFLYQLRGFFFVRCPVSVLSTLFGYLFWLYFSYFLCGIAYVGASFGFRFDAVRY